MASMDEIKAAFGKVCDLPEDQQADWLKTNYGHDPELIEEVMLLLDSEREADDAGFLEGALLQIDDNNPDTQHTVRRYRLGRKLGEGGMGTVYLAEFEDEGLKRTVAVKILKRGMDTDHILRRFYKERHILANMDHPNLAAVYDSGSTEDGLPFFVMEYIDGMPIHHYCEEKKLEVRERLELFIQVCGAVSYAHRNLVVHRDIKPANILVTTNSHVKLMDFGIAKIVNDTDPAQQTQTVEHQRVMTPAYASPEQLLCEAITTASDVYSLGLLLYQLLTDRQPFTATDETGEKVYHQLANQSPPPPSRVNTGQLSQDLDRIVAKAMQRKPEYRYASVDALADDIRRYLDGFPILAQPPRWSYRMRKFAGRHKRGLVAAGLAAALFIQLLFSLFNQRQEALRQRDLAEKSLAAEATARQAEAELSAFLLNVFQVADPVSSGGKDQKAVDLMDKAVADMEKNQDLEPLVMLRFKTVMAEAYLNLSFFEKGANLLRDELAKHEDGPITVEQIRAYNQLGKVVMNQSLYYEATEVLEISLGKLEKLERADPILIAKTLDQIAEARQYTYRLDEAIEAAEKARVIWEREYGADSPKMAQNTALRAMLLEEVGDYDASEALYRKAIPLKIAEVGKRHNDLATIMNNFAIVLEKRGKWEEAEAYYLQAAETHEEILGPNNHRMAASLDNLGTLNTKMGNHQKALDYFQRSLKITEAHFGPTNYNVATIKSNSSLCLGKLERFDEAEKAAREAIAIYQKLKKGDSPYVGIAQIGLARALYGHNRLKEAMSELDNARQTLANGLGEDHPALGRILYERGRIFEAENKLDQARDMYQQSLAIRIKGYGEDHYTTKESQTALGRLGGAN